MFLLCCLFEYCVLETLQVHSTWFFYIANAYPLLSYDQLFSPINFRVQKKKKSNDFVTRSNRPTVACAFRSNYCTRAFRCLPLDERALSQRWLVWKGGADEMMPEELSLLFWSEFSLLGQKDDSSRSEPWHRAQVSETCQWCSNTVSVPVTPVITPVSPVMNVNNPPCASDELLLLVTSSSSTWSWTISHSGWHHHHSSHRSGGGLLLLLVSPPSVVSSRLDVLFVCMKQLGKYGLGKRHT